MKRKIIKRGLSNFRRCFLGAHLRFHILHARTRRKFWRLGARFLFDRGGRWPFRICCIDGKGVGAVATREIRMGERILEGE
jgi:hypothetical protein